MYLDQFNLAQIQKILFYLVILYTHVFFLILYLDQLNPLLH
jgi:hypothetical protein